MKAIVERSAHGVLAVSCDAATYADFRKIVRHLEERFGGRVVDKADGPDARRWRLVVDGKEIIVDQCDLGPFPLSLWGSDPVAEEIVTRVARSLEEL